MKGNDKLLAALNERSQIEQMGLENYLSNQIETTAK